ncbi:MAG: type II toxin-antitoxin system VapC family toxin [Planctomycetaceae bacterium]|nr:type II toxin-antitoxin system VapC family toxin [Planctomycetaceae bacterium]
MMVFADAFALIAWLNPRDRAHADVVSYLERYRGRLVTTEWVLMEVADALSSPEARGPVAAFLRAVRADAQFEIVGYLPSPYDAGLKLFAARADKAWSLTDCISFGVMSERKLVDALTADHHFEQAGLKAIFRDATQP